MREWIAQEIRILVTRLANREDMPDVYARSRCEREDVERVLNQYFATFIIPPSDAYKDLEPIEVEDTDILSLAIDVEMYSVEEGRSDMSVQLTAEVKGDVIELQIDDVRVM